MQKITVLAGIVVDKNRVLITRRAPNEAHSGGWEFPGGKLKGNETYSECLVRELKEELGITVNVNEFCTEVIHDYGDMVIDLYAYYCTIRDGEISLTVHDQYLWVKADELLMNTSLAI